MAEQTRLTDAELETLREKITPGPWSWWTSCSFRRLSAKGDGDVLCATTQSDGHPDVHLKNGGWKGPDGCLIEISPNLLAEVIERRARDASVAELIAAARGVVWSPRVASAAHDRLRAALAALNSGATTNEVKL